MSVKPIDLQIMYSQMSNIEKVASHQQNGGQLANALQQNKIIQAGIEHSQTVKKSADNDSKSAVVNPDGKNPDTGQSFSKNKNNASQDETAKKEIEIRDPNLGQHIDITR